ncbi:MAG TPA: hypothetical protein VFX21_09325, partial [Acidimicrobiia bacterium]|nr:hypothetical protein [Acidimicrobiia bacterium]
TLTGWAPRAPVLARRLAAYACGATLAVQPAIAHAATADVPVVRAPATATTTTSAPAPEIAPEPAVTDAPAPPPVATPVSANYLVAPGDNLWRIAAAELTRRTGATPDEDAIARYWRAVVDANRSTLRSGEPSLIYPGELVVLPAP